MARCWKDPTTKDAYRLSWASIFITVIAAIAGVTIYASNNSSLALVFGLENCVDFLSSVVVLWRFFAPTKADPSVEEKLQRREKRASIAISIVLIMLGVAILATSFFDFSRGKEDQDENLDQITIISFFSVIAFGTLAAFKFNYANILESASLYKDGLCSLIGTILAGTLFINSLIIEEFTALWWIDPLVSLACGIGAIVLGSFHLYQARYKDNLPIFSYQWWALSQGDGKDERSGRPVGAEDMPIESNDAELEMKEKEVEGEVV